jgi:hypothetical protein
VTRRPDFFLVGAPKSGTTALYEYLRQHPEIYLPARKEMRFFGSDLEIRDRRRLSLEEYLAEFAEAGDARRVGSAYVWYLFSRAAAREIHGFAPDAQIVAMLRNPVDMLHALHGEHLSNGNEEIADFTAALDAEEDRRAGRRIPPHAHLPQGLLYSEVPRYSEQLGRYFAEFGRSRVHVIVFDDFAADTPRVYRETLRFLGVAEAFVPAEFAVVNRSHRTRSEWFRHFLARPPEPARRLIRWTMPAPLRRALYERAKRANAAIAPRAPMPEATRERLRREFADEVERLSALLERDLGGWLRGDGRLAPQAEAERASVEPGDASASPRSARAETSSS